MVNECLTWTFSSKNIYSRSLSTSMFLAFTLDNFGTLIGSIKYLIIIHAYVFMEPPVAEEFSSVF